MWCRYCFVVLCISRVWKYWCEFDDKNMTSIEWCDLWIWCDWKVLILLVFWEVLRLDFLWFVRWNFLIKNVIFGWVRWNALFSRIWGDFGRLFWWFLMIWKVAKCLIFQCFVELITELENGGLDVETTDMPFPASGCLP